jgi:purine-binding chemotaxis protein CheW
MSPKTHQFCTFFLGDLYLGIQVFHVQEVIRVQDMTRVPLAPKAVCGLINLRGQIVTALDLRVQLGLPKRLNHEIPMNVVVRDGENAVSLLVDRIGDVVEVEDELFEHTPPTVPADVREFVAGAYKLPKQLLLVLNIERAIHTSEDSLLKTA